MTRISPAAAEAAAEAAAGATAAERGLAPAMRQLALISSMILPICVLDSINAWASAARVIGTTL